MGATATKLSTDEKKARIASLFEHHKETFKKMGIEQKDYIPKLFYPIIGGDLVVSMFTSEMNRERDVFLENASPEFELVEEERRLFRLRYNAAYKEEYVVEGETPYFRYIVPVEELEEVTEQQGEMLLTETVKPEDTQTKFNVKGVPTEEERVNNVLPPDCRMNEITVRDHLAILYGKPISNKQWLNELIEENR